MNKILTASEPIALTNVEFLQDVASAAPDGTQFWTCSFAGDPQGSKFWSGMGYAAEVGPSKHADVNAHLNTYFSVAAVGPSEDGKFYRRRANFARLLALVLDDCDLESIDGVPSYVIQTSPAKQQVGLLVDHSAPETADGEPAFVVEMIEVEPAKQQVGFLMSAADPDCANEALVGELVRTMIESGKISGDPNGNNSVRYVRLPNGTNQKPRPSGHFKHRVTHWEPQNRYTLAQAAAMLRIDLEDIRASLVEEAAAKASEAQDSFDYAPDFANDAVGGVVQDVPRNPSAAKGPGSSTKGKSTAQMTADILSGAPGMHDNIRDLAASMLASGAAGGYIVSHLRELVSACNGPHDARWQGHFDDIPRQVSSGEKYSRAPNAKAPRPAVPAARPSVPSAVSDDAALTAPEVTAKRENMFARGCDLMADLKPTQWIVEDFFEKDALGMTFGAPGAGKSFLIFDMALHVAGGTEWNGRATMPGAVIYLAGEGREGAKRRMKAWSNENNLPIHPNFIISKCSIALFDEEAGQRVIEDVEELCAGRAAPVLIVVDTLARSMAGGDENSTKDASSFINKIDVLRERWACHVHLVHHTPLGDEGRARGSVAFKGAMDQEFSVRENKLTGVREFTALKMKDGAKPDPVHYKLVSRVVNEGVNQFGKPFRDTSCTVQMLGSDDLPAGRTNSRSAGITPRDVVLHLVDGWPGGDALGAQLGVNPKTAMKAVADCVKLGHVKKDGKKFLLTSSGRRLNMSSPDDESDAAEDPPWNSQE